MLCCVVVCYALLCYAKLCYAMPPFAMLSQARSGIFRHPQASPRSSKLCNANHCKTMYKKKHLIGVAPGSLDDFSSFLAYFGHVFGCSCWGGFSLFLARSSANFAKKIQELAEDKAENPRTCRGQSREENPYERLQENSNLQAFFFQTPFLIATLPTPKTLGGGTPPQGGFN